MQILGQKTDFIINRKSGAVLKAGEDEIRQSIEAGFPDTARGEIRFVEGGEVAAAVKDWAEKNAGSGRRLVVGGGDGTLITATEILLGRKDVALGVLPMGTQNMIARQLGFSPDIKTAIAQYAAGDEVEMDVGKVNGQCFLVGLVLDQHSVRLFEAREALREKKYPAAIKKAFAAAVGVLFGLKKDFLVSARADWTQHGVRRGKIFAVMNGKIEPRCYHDMPDEGGKLKNAVAGMIAKGEPGAGELAFYTFDGGVAKTLSLLPQTVQGTWVSHKAVKLDTAQQFYIQRPRRKDEPDAVPLILDGEIKTLTYPLDVRLVPKGLKIFRPKL